MLLDLYKIQHDIPKKDRNRVHALYCDLLEINNIVEDHVDVNKYLSLHYQDWHDEYSPERTDPCPDYYGTYTLLDRLGEKVGINMNVDELDTVLCSLLEFIEHLYYKK